MHDQEKRLRREVANSNERRRMQSINAGFQSLRNLIPHGDGEKLSKAAILQQTVGYIAALESEKTRLMTVNQQLHQMLQDKSPSSGKDLSPPPKRKKRDTESSDEGIGMTIEEQSIVDIRREMVALRKALERERSQRMALEEQKVELEAQVYPAKIRRAASEIQYHEEQQRLLQDERRNRDRERTWSEPPQRPSRNMEILLEAFRVIEGDRGLFANDEKAKSEPMSDEEMSYGCESPLSRMSDSDVKQEPLGPPAPATAAATMLHHHPMHILLPHPLPLIAPHTS
jgi:hypothetical protein